VTDGLILEVADFEVDVLTGIYSEETGKPQPCAFHRGAAEARRTLCARHAAERQQELHGPEVCRIGRAAAGCTSR
jgi:hypothetical protein